MIAPLRLILAALLWAAINSAAWSQATCTATAVPVTFAPVTSLTTSTGSGALNVSCGGGTGSEQVFICLTLGAGSGGSAGNGTNVRYLLNGAIKPDYSLTVPASTPLTVGTKTAIGSITLSDGSGTGSFTINGSVDWSGYTGQPDSLTSSFAPQDVTLSHGSTSDCLDGTSQVSSFYVTGAYYAACEVSAGAMNFGSISPANSAASGQSYVYVTCPNTTAYTVSLGDGQSFGLRSGFSGQRAMKNGSEYLAYNFYEDAGASAPWNGVAGTGNASTQSIPVFGRIPSGQNNLAAGTYSDIVVVTVEYTLPN